MEKKYLLQFCIKAEPDDEVMPHDIPMEGVFAKDREDTTRLLAAVFDRFPKYRIAIISTVTERDGVLFTDFDSIAVNEEWNGVKLKGIGVKVPKEMFNMME